MKYLKKIKEKVYESSPIFFQNLLISYYGKKLIEQRYRNTYFDKKKSFINSFPKEFDIEIKNQNEKLIDFVKFAVKHSEFYKDLYESVDIDNFAGLSDLKELPIVSKELLRRNIDNVYTIPKNKGIVSFTGGTTGKSLEVVFTSDDFQERMAYLDAFKSKLGVNPFEVTKATFSGRELVHSSRENIFWRDNKPYKQRLYSTFHLNEKNLIHYIENLNQYRPQVLNGFVSAIYEVSKFIKNNNLILTFQPKAIFTTSETLLPFHRELIEEVFNSKIYNQYASAEGAPFITECEQGNLHYNLDTGVIENKEGSNEILVTSFTTHGTPLIRYDIGDEVEFMQGSCNCGSSHPLVKAVKGRMVDFLVASDGSKVSLSHLADVIKGMPTCIKKVQFCQNVLDEVKVKIVIDELQYQSKYDDLIIDSVKYRFGYEVSVVIEKVEDIPREKSGKYSLIKNKLKNGK